MDIYTGPVGQASVTTQVHDYSPGITSNGLFWVIPVARDSVAIDLDNATASLKLDNVPVMDAHDIANSLTGGQGLANPPIPPIAPVPATVSFDIEWSGMIAEAKIVNEAENFRGRYVQTGATISWSASQAGFDFISEPVDPSRNIYSVLCHEQNGLFFHPD